MNSGPPSTSIMNDIKQLWETLTLHDVWDKNPVTVRERSSVCNVQVLLAVSELTGYVWAPSSSRWAEKHDVLFYELQASGTCSDLSMEGLMPCGPHTYFHTLIRPHCTSHWQVVSENGWEGLDVKREEDGRGLGGNGDLKSSEAPRASMWWMMDGMSFWSDCQWPF